LRKFELMSLHIKKLKLNSFSFILSLLIGFTLAFFQYRTTSISLIFTGLSFTFFTFLSWQIILIAYQKNKVNLTAKISYFLLHFVLLIFFSWLIKFLFKNTFYWNFNSIFFLLLIELFFVTCFELKYALIRTKKVLTEYNEFKINEVEFKLQVLQEQLNPHFLFNSLNVLKSLINIDPEKAIKYTIDLADLLRITIDSDKKETSVKEELDLCSLYLSIQNSRFNNNIFLNVALNPQEKQYKIPFLTLIILIENAIKHNVISTQQKLFINLSIDGDYLILKNNLNKKHHTLIRKGIGLDSINYRCKLLVNKELEIQENKDYFSIKIPFKND